MSDRYGGARLCSVLNISIAVIDYVAALLLSHLLQDLNFNFQTVILPEALTAFQAEEPSVLSIVKDLDGLVSWVGTPLDNIIETLEQLVVNATSLGGAAFTMSVSYFCTDFMSA